MRLERFWWLTNADMKLSRKVVAAQNSEGLGAVTQGGGTFFLTALGKP